MARSAWEFEEMGRQVRARILDFALLAIALVGPVLHLAGFLTQGPALLYSDRNRLGVTYALLGLSAATAALVLLRRPDSLVRLLTAAALLANFGSIGYIGGMWWRGVQQDLAEVAMAPVEAGQVGIAVSPADLSPAASADAQDVEMAISEIVSRGGLKSYVAVRRAHPISSDEQALRVGRKLGASVVVWQTRQGHDPIVTEQHVTVSGAGKTVMELEPVSLMLLMITRQTFMVRSTGPADDADASAPTTQIVALVAAGFGSLTAGRPELAAAQFRSATALENVPTRTLRSLYNYRATALLWADRPDLVLRQNEQTSGIPPDARTWAIMGNARLMRREWQAAADAFGRAIALDPYYSVPYCGLGVLFARERNVSGAISSYGPAIALEPGWGAPYALLGLALELEANIDAASEAYGVCEQRAWLNPGLGEAASARAEKIARHPPTAVPTATRPPVPTLTPVPTSRIYLVKQGDTLQAIAAELGVSFQRLVEINRLEDPNAIRIGQLLIIPESR